MTWKPTRKSCQDTWQEQLWDAAYEEGRADMLEKVTEVISRWSSVGLTDVPAQSIITALYETEK